MGSADFSVPTLAKLIEAGHEIAYIYTQPPRRSGRGKKVNLTPVHEMAQSLEYQLELLKILNLN